MNMKLKYMVGAVAIGLVLVVGYVMKFGLYPQFFDISWDEEVQLHDGRVIVVSVKRLYERQRLTLSRFDVDSIQYRGATMQFNTDANQRQTIQTRQPIGYLGMIEGNWYIVIGGQGPYGLPAEPPTRWGSDFTTREQRLAKLLNGEFLPIAWDAAPQVLTTMNLMGTAFFPEFAKWHGKVLTINMKQAFFTAYPSPGGAEITRPLRMKLTQEGPK